MEYSIGPQRDAIAVEVEIESVARAKIWDTDARVTVFVIAISVLKLKEIIVPGQGSYTVTVNDRTGAVESYKGVANVERLKFTVWPMSV